MTRTEVRDSLVRFMMDRMEIPFGEDPELDDDTNLFESGNIDSLDSLVLLTFLEKTFKVTVEPDDLIENPLNSVNEIVDFVTSRGTTD